MRFRLLSTIACCAALALAGCGGSSKSLGTSGESLEFVVAVVRGESPSDWELAEDAGRLAVAAWAHQDQLSGLGRALRRTPDWSCKAANWTLKVRKIDGLYLKVSDRDRLAIKRGSGLPEYQWEEVDQVIDEVLPLTAWEAAKAIDSACSLSSQF